MKTRTRIIAAFCGALALPLSFAPFNCWPLMILSLGLLFCSIKMMSPRVAFYLGILYGVVGYGLSLSWFWNIFGVAAIGLYALMALFVAIFCLICSYYWDSEHADLLKVLFAALLWTAMEFYRSELFPLRFPWITPGAALGPNLLSPFIGVYGVSFLVVAAASSFMFRPRSWACFLLACIAGIALLRPGPVAPDKDDAIIVATVQGEHGFLDPYLSLSRELAAEKPDLIIWPEHALPYDVRKQRSDLQKLKQLCAEMDSLLILGTKTIVGPFDFVGVGDKNWYNTALLIDANGVVGEYHKNRPVHLFNDGIPANRADPINTDLGTIATPICFDCDFTAIARRMADSGAEFFAVPSFDASSWSARQHLQHASMFRLRAAENGRWFAVAASSGVSQFIDPHGHVHASLPLMKAGVMTYRVEALQKKTFFTSYGWLFPWMAIVLSSALLLLHFSSTIEKSTMRG